MRILELKEKFQFELPGTNGLIKAQEFSLTTNPGRLTYGDIINDLETQFSLDGLSFSSDLLHELIYERKDLFFRDKYGLSDNHNLLFLKKGLWVIDGDPIFDYIGLSRVTYWSSDGHAVSSEGPNGNYLLESWLQGKPEYENRRYSFITLDP